MTSFIGSILQEAKARIIATPDWDVDERVVRIIVDENRVVIEEPETILLAAKAAGGRPHGHNLVSGVMRAAIVLRRHLDKYGDHTAVLTSTEERSLGLWTYRFIELFEHASLNGTLVGYLQRREVSSPRMIPEGGDGDPHVMQYVDFAWTVYLPNVEHLNVPLGQGRGSTQVDRGQEVTA